MDEGIRSLSTIIWKSQTNYLPLQKKVMKKTTVPASQVKKYRLPESSMIFIVPTSAGKFLQDQVTAAIQYLRSLGAPCYENTTEFDPNFPSLTWSPGTAGEISQSALTSGTQKGYTIEAYSLEEFVAMFEPEYIEIKVEDATEKYNAVVCPDKVMVGCQTVSAKKFKEIVEAAKKTGLID